MVLSGNVHVFFHVHEPAWPVSQFSNQSFHSAIQCWRDYSQFAPKPARPPYHPARLPTRPNQLAPLILPTRPTSTTNSPHVLTNSPQLLPTRPTSLTNSPTSLTNSHHFSYQLVPRFCKLPPLLGPSRLRL